MTPQLAQNLSLSHSTFAPGEFLPDQGVAAPAHSMPDPDVYGEIFGTRFHPKAHIANGEGSNFGSSGILLREKKSVLETPDLEPASLAIHEASPVSAEDEALFAALGEDEILKMLANDRGFFEIAREKLGIVFRDGWPETVAELETLAVRLRESNEVFDSNWNSKRLYRNLSPDFIKDQNDWIAKLICWDHILFGTLYMGWICGLGIALGYLSGLLESNRYKDNPNLDAFDIHATMLKKRIWTKNRDWQRQQIDDCLEKLRSYTLEDFFAEPANLLYFFSTVYPQYLEKEIEKFNQIISELKSANTNIQARCDYEVSLFSAEEEKEQLRELYTGLIDNNLKKISEIENGPISTFKQARTLCFQAQQKLEEKMSLLNIETRRLEAWENAKELAKDNAKRLAEIEFQIKMSRDRMQGILMQVADYSRHITSRLKGRIENAEL